MDHVWCKSSAGPSQTESDWIRCICSHTLMDGASGETRILVPLSNELHQHINTRLVQWHEGRVCDADERIHDRCSPLGRRRSVAPVHPQTPDRFRSSLHRCSSQTEPLSSGSVRFGCPTFTDPCEAASGLIRVTSDLHQPNLIRTSAVLRMRVSLCTEQRFN